MFNRSARLCLLLPALCALGCTRDQLKQVVGDDTAIGHDSALDTGDTGDSLPIGDSDESGDSVGDSAPDTAAGAEVDASFNVIYQESSYDHLVGLCVVQVAYYEPADGDTSGTGSGTVMAMPTSPGECAYTAFDPEEEVDPGPIEIRGTLSAGDAVTLSDDAAIVLPAEEQDNGELTYRLADCTQTNFPFARTLDLSAPGSADVPAHALHQPVAVGPNLVRVLPDDADLEGGLVVQSVAQPLEWAWTYASDPPETAEGPIIPQEMFVIRHRTVADNFTFEALACMPGAQGELDVPAEAMALLSPDATDGSTYTSSQVDVYWDGPDVDTPWGQLLRVRSIITFGGLMTLTE